MENQSLDEYIYIYRVSGGKLPSLIRFLVRFN